MFEKARVKTISVGELPEVLTTKYMFYYTIARTVSDIKFGKPTEYLDSTAWMFAYSNINILGDVILKGTTISEGEAMFYAAYIDMFPYIKLAFSGTADRIGTRNLRNSRIFRVLGSKYMLEAEVRSVDGDTSTSDSYYNSLGYMNNNHNYAFMAYTGLRFTGMSLILNIILDLVIRLILNTHFIILVN
jgi:hypothetical protein